MTWLLRSHNIHLSLNGRWISVTEKSNPSVTESSLILNYNELQRSKALLYIHQRKCKWSKNPGTDNCQTCYKDKKHRLLYLAGYREAQPLIWKRFFSFSCKEDHFTRTVVQLASFWKWGFLELRSGLFATSHAPQNWRNLGQVNFRKGIGDCY